MQFDLKKVVVEFDFTDSAGSNCPMRWDCAVDKNSLTVKHAVCDLRFQRKEFGRQRFRVQYLTRFQSFKVNTWRNDSGTPAKFKMKDEDVPTLDPRHPVKIAFKHLCNHHYIREDKKFIKNIKSLLTAKSTTTNDGNIMHLDEEIPETPAPAHPTFENENTATKPNGKRTIQEAKKRAAERFEQQRKDNLAHAASVKDHAEIMAVKAENLKKEKNKRKTVDDERLTDLEKDINDAKQKYYRALRERSKKYDSEKATAIQTKQKEMRLKRAEWKKELKTLQDKIEVNESPGKIKSTHTAAATGVNEKRPQPRSTPANSPAQDHKEEEHVIVQDHPVQETKPQSPPAPKKYFVNYSGWKIDGESDEEFHELLMNGEKDKTKFKICSRGNRKKHIAIYIPTDSVESKVITKTRVQLYDRDWFKCKFVGNKQRPTIIYTLKMPKTITPEQKRSMTMEELRKAAKTETMRIRFAPSGEDDKTYLDDAKQIAMMLYGPAKHCRRFACDKTLEDLIQALKGGDLLKFRPKHRRGNSLAAIAALAAKCGNPARVSHD